MTVEGARSVCYGSIVMEDYAPSSAEIIAAYDPRSPNQLGDPTKLGSALLKFADLDKLPVRFLASSDALDRLLGKTEFLHSTAEQWRELPISTDSSR